MLADAEGLLTCYGVGEESTGQLTHAVIELCFTSSVRFLQPGLLLQVRSLLPAGIKLTAESPQRHQWVAASRGECHGGRMHLCRAWAQGRLRTPSAGRSPGSLGRCASGRSAPLSRRAWQSGRHAHSQLRPLLQCHECTEPSWISAQSLHTSAAAS